MYCLIVLNVLNNRDLYGITVSTVKDKNPFIVRVAWRGVRDIMRAF